MAEHIAFGGLWYVVFLFSITMHEAAHAWVALRGGDPTAALSGQVTLDPRPHIRREPFGTVVVPILTYFTLGWMMGWASAPYDPAWADRYLRELRAITGPHADLSTTEHALRLGMDGSYFSSRLSKLRSALDRQLGPAAGAYRIDDGGSKPHRYRLALDGEAVKVLGSGGAGGR